MRFIAAQGPSASFNAVETSSRVLVRNAGQVADRRELRECLRLAYEAGLGDIGEGLTSTRRTGLPSCYDAPMLLLAK